MYHWDSYKTIPSSLACQKTVSIFIAIKIIMGEAPKFASLLLYFLAMASPT